LGRANCPVLAGVASEAQRKGLLAVDLDKAPGEYDLKVTGQTASGEKISCSARVAVRKGRFATEKLQVGKQFVEPSPEQIKRADEERQKLRDIFDRVNAGAPVGRKVPNAAGGRDNGLEFWQEADSEWESRVTT